MTTQKQSKSRLAAAALCAAMCMAMTPFGSSAACDEAGRDRFALQRAEFAKYYKQITGKEAPDGMVKFAVDPKVSKSGRDAYAIVSSDDGEGGCCVRDDGEGAVATHAVGGGSEHAVSVST